MSKTVTIRYTNGQAKKVVLGEEKTCPSAQPRGWGTKCETLALKINGLYHCNDCGLVFKKAVQDEKSRVILVACDCVKLTNFLEWYFDECYGYDCPISRYHCEKCGRIYQSLSEASVRLQESKVAKEYVQRNINYQKKRQAEMIDMVSRDAVELKKKLRRVPRSVRQKILKELAG